MTTTYPINVIHIGLGASGRHWLEVVRGRPDIRTVGCVDSDATALEWVRTRFPEHRHVCYEQLEEALRCIKADTAIIASPPALRAGHAIQALEAGMAVAIEPPLAISLVGAAQMMAASHHSSQPLIPAQSHQHTRCEATVRQLVRDGRLGAITHVSYLDRRSCEAQDQVSPQTDYAQVLHVGAHHFARLQRMLGVNPVSVMARCSNTPWGPYQHGSRTEALLEMEHNIHIQYYGSLTSNRRDHVLWLEGDRGVLWTDFSRLWWRKRGWRFFLPLSVYEILATHTGKSSRHGTIAWLDQLKAAVVEGRPPDTSDGASLWTAAMVEAAMLSDRVGKVVHIDDLFHSAGIQLDALPRDSVGRDS
jgi:predicted dehydrogenase